VLCCVKELEVLRGQLELVQGLIEVLLLVRLEIR